MVYRNIPTIDKYYDPLNPRAKPNFEFKMKPMEAWKQEKTSCVCQCCGTSRLLYMFPETVDNTWGYTQKPPNKSSTTVSRGLYCIPCLNAIGEKFSKDPNMNKEKALCRICMMLDVYFDANLARQVIYDTNPLFPDGTPVDQRIGWVDRYLRALRGDSDLWGKTFFDSDNFIFDAIEEHQCTPEQQQMKQAQLLAMKEELEQLREEKRNTKWEKLSDYEIEQLNKKKDDADKNVPQQVVLPQKSKLDDKDKFNYLSPQSKEARTQVLQTFHKDPFFDETLDDCESMYIDLATMIDDTMVDDLLRQKSAIEVVRIYNRIEKLSEAIRELQATPQLIIDNSKALQSLITQKSNELKNVTQLAKDHGFAERYAMSKSRGSGTFSAIVREMQEADFDPGAINKYDIATSAAIKQVSEISANAIISQVALSDSEFAQMVQEQAIEIRKQKEELDRTKEQLRLLRETVAKDEIIEKYKQELIRKRMPKDEIDALVKGEWSW